MWRKSEDSKAKPALVILTINCAVQLVRGLTVKDANPMPALHRRKWMLLGHRFWLRCLTRRTELERPAP